MIITEPEVKKTVQDYDILLDAGVVIPITVDTAAGDTFYIDQYKITFNRAAKPSQTDPNTVIPAEKHTIFLAHVRSIQSRDREVVELNASQKAELQHTWAEYLTHPTVQ